ncbi:efflux RND transporter periplasmic adaptor subunit [Glaciecola sp. 1036]|uniref:efflux RND transporter periplasmic adaptor subunit n=1 Tax=Alteromonadaceae TaxID=72275 RepID=UPI003D07F6F7
MNRALLFSTLLLVSQITLAQMSPRASKVLVEPLSFESALLEIEAVGTAEAVRSVTLYPAVADRVTKINFVPGQQVGEGDILLELDNRRQRIAIERAKIELQDAKRNFNRIKESLDRGAVTQSQLDDTETLVKLAEIALEQAQTELDDRILRAPFAGIVGFTEIEVGDRINIQTPVTTLDDRSALYVNFAAPEASIVELNNDPEVVLQPWSNRNESIIANIAQLDSRISEEDRTLRVRAIFENTEDAFRPGMSFRVKLSAEGERFVSVPEAALAWGTNGAYVWLAVDGQAQKVSVQVQQRLRGRILVSGELLQGQMLIAEGIQRLREGQEVDAEVIAKAAPLSRARLNEATSG